MFRYNFVPLRLEGNALVVAMADPSDLVVIDEVSALLSSRWSSMSLRSPNTGPAQKSESSQRMLEEATEGFKLDLIREMSPATRRCDRENHSGRAQPIIRLVDDHLHGAREASESTSGDNEVGEISNRRVAGRSYGADRQGTPRRYFENKVVRTPFPGGAFPDGFRPRDTRDVRSSPCFDHALHQRRRCRHPYSRQGIH